MVHHAYLIYQADIVAHDSTSLQNRCPCGVCRLVRPYSKDDVCKGRIGQKGIWRYCF